MTARWLVPAAGLALMLYLARSILSPFIIAAVLAYVFSPLVDELQGRLRIRRPLVIALLYVVVLTALGLGIWLLESRLVREARALGEAGPDLVEAAFVRLLGSSSFQFLDQRADAHTLAEWARFQVVGALGNPTDALHVAERALDTVLKTFLALIALVYLLLDGPRIGDYLQRFVPSPHRPRVDTVAEHIHRVFARYVRGQLFLVALMTTVTFLVLELIFHLPYALPIAILTGILEIIPFLGPVVAGGIAATVGLVQGGQGTMLGVIVAYVVLRQLEDQLVMPFVVGRAVELHPLVTIFAVLTGAAVAGVLGALLAVPAAAALRVLIDEIYGSPEADENAT